MLKASNYYAVYFDFLGFGECIQEISRHHDIPAGKVRDDVIGEIKKVIENAKGEKTIFWKHYDASIDSWLVFCGNFFYAEEIIGLIHNTPFPYKFDKIYFEIAIGLIETEEEELRDWETLGDETIEFLKSNIIKKYNKYYKRRNGISPRETFILITNDVYKSLNQEDQRKFERIEEGKSVFYVVKSLETFLKKEKEKKDIGSKKHNSKSTIEEYKKGNDKIAVSDYFETIKKLCTKRDYRYLKLIRELIEEEYISLRDKDLEREGSLEDKRLVQTLLDDIKNIDQTIDFDVLLRIEFDDDLKNCVFKYDSEVVTINNPKLLKDCTCGIPEKYRNKKYECKIHSDEERGKKITKRFGKNYTFIKYRGVDVCWFDDFNDLLWPPSIDTLFMAKQMYGRYKEKILRDVLDVGCGTGFLGIFLRKINPNIRNLYFSDLLMTPLLFTKVNCMGNNITENTNIFYHQSNCLDGIKTEEFIKNIDLIVCNPPYMPDLGFEKLKRNNAVSGTYLLKNIILEARNYTNELILGCSDMAEREFHEAIYKSNAAYTVLGSNKVPFRIPYAFKNQEFMDKMIQEKRVKKFRRSGFKYYHTFKVYSITY